MRSGREVPQRIGVFVVKASRGLPLALHHQPPTVDGPPTSSEWLLALFSDKMAVFVDLLLCTAFLLGPFGPLAHWPTKGVVAILKCEVMGHNLSFCCIKESLGSCSVGSQSPVFCTGHATPPEGSGGFLQLAAGSWDSTHHHTNGIVLSFCCLCRERDIGVVRR